MGRLERIDRLLTRGLTAVVTVCFLVLAVLVVTLVVLRYVFNTTIIGGNELTAHLFIYTTALGAAVSVATGQHIRIGIFVDALPPRAALAVDAVALLLVLLLHVCLLWFSASWIASVGAFAIPVINIPQGIVQAAIPIGCVFVIVFCLTRLATLVGRMRTPR
ncbi:MAG: TRAP transporter small permease subunit [Rhodospirillales bacterium]|nr:TRAP transporter small permease subunit [Rhodospirillales bacterium]